MTAKQFFKSTAFKCIVVLVSIMLVCCIFLTICNSLFFVSDKERLDRAIGKLYGGTVQYDDTYEVDKTIETKSSTVNTVYPITDEKHPGDYLINVTGKGGYGGGTVTCWVIVNVTEGDVTVKKASIASNVGQSYIAKVTDGAIDKLIKKQDSDTFTSFDTKGIKTGASYSMGAISNALNGAVSYVKASVLNTKSKFEGYSFSQYIDDEACPDPTVAGTVVTYTLKTTTITVGEKGLIPGPFALTVSVGEGASITALTVTEYGSVAGKGQTKEHYDQIAQTNAAQFIGKDEAYFKSIVGADASVATSANYPAELTAGASQSTYHVIYACLFATSNYSKAVVDFGQGGNS